MSYTLTPSSHHVYNEFDRFGLLLGLPRLKEEKNAAYKRRLLDVLVRRASSTYLGLIYGITRELGLEVNHVMTIEPVLDGDGNPLLTLPAVVFEHTKCYLYSDYSEKTLLDTIDRFEINEGGYTLEQLVETINNTGYFTATLTGKVSSQKRAMTIYNQSSIMLVAAEDITGQGGKVKLDGRNIIPGTVSVRSPNLYRRVSSESAIRRPGDYTIDLENGLIISSVAPASGSVIRYQWRDDEFEVQASPVIIHNLQSDDFRTKMFEQLLDDEGNAINGLPTELGADIINELLSVYPSNWGE